MANQPHAIAVVMDGSCALCAFGAKMVHRLDKSGTIKIAPIQGQAGTILMQSHGLDPIDPESWLFIEKDGTVSRDLESPRTVFIETDLRRTLST